MFYPPSQSRAWQHLCAGLCAVTIGLGTLTSCVHRAPKTAATVAGGVVRQAGQPGAGPPSRTIPPAPVTPDLRLGVVRVIGARGNFVLIETPSAAATAAVQPGRILHCRPPGIMAGGISADLRVSPERRQPFVVADVISGNAAVGDVAYFAKDSDSVLPLRNVAPYSPPIPAAAPSPTPQANP